MNILIAGSSGLIGNVLYNYFTSQEHQVHRLVRANTSDGPFCWQPSDNFIHLDNSTAIDVVINLAGASIGDGRWSEKRKKVILESRVKSTNLLSRAIINLPAKPKLFISASAVGYYGDTGNKETDEDGQAGTGFLTDVCELWEQATLPAVRAGIRTTYLRTGVVLSTTGGALKKMLFPFKMGLGGKVGTGQQFMSWISISEIPHILDFMINNESISGPVNIVSKVPVTNLEFTKTLGAVLHRPTLFPLPGSVAKLLLGEMADELLLASSRVIPNKLEKSGYPFVNDDLTTTLTKLLKDNL